MLRTIESGGWGFYKVLQDALFFSAVSHGTYSTGSTEVTVPRTKPILGCVHLFLPNADSCRSAPGPSLAPQSLHYIQFNSNSLEQEEEGYCFRSVTESLTFLARRERIQM